MAGPAKQLNIARLKPKLGISAFTFNVGEKPGPHFMAEPFATMGTIMGPDAPYFGKQSRLSGFFSLVFHIFKDNIIITSIMFVKVNRLDYNRAWSVTALGFFCLKGRY